MLTILDNDLANIGSVTRALQFLNLNYRLARDLIEIEKAEKLILPGVGSFKAASKSFLTDSYISLVKHLVLDRKVPIFGFCLGMQLLGEFGEEKGESRGLGLLQGRTVHLRVDSNKYAIPHMGWNDVSPNGLDMFKDVPDQTCFYFVHSFEFISKDPMTKQATVNYGDLDICAAIQKEHIWGAQFHPEKSQKFGLKLLQNFKSL